jgi:hypothetical protein
MNYEMQKANLLADNINEFMKFVFEATENKRSSILNTDKLFQIKLLIEEFKFRIIADELHRINQYSWDERYTTILVNQFREGISIIDEYVKNHYNELFMLTGRLHTLNNLSTSFSK